MLIAGFTSPAFAQNMPGLAVDAVSEINAGRFSEANPNTSGVGEGALADDKTKHPNYYSPKNTNVQTAGGIEASILNGCNCVVFRLDDLQDYWIPNVQATVMDQFVQKNQFLSIGPIFDIFGADSTVVNKAVAGYNSGLFEVFVHGWDHVDYTNLSLATQTSTLQQAQNKAALIFGSPSKVFVPPYNALNANTLTAIKNTGFEIISAAEYTDTYPYFIADGFSNITDSLGNYHEPESIGFVQYDNSGAVRVPNSQILAAIDSSIASKGYAVVTVHSQEFAQVQGGSEINVPDQNLLNDLNFIIDGVLSKNYPIRTFAQVVQFNQSPTPTIAINDVSVTEGNSGTKNFVFAVTRSANTPAISVQYQTADNTATTPSDYTSLSLTTLNFASGGPLTQTVTVSVKGDTTVEPDETFHVNLSNCSGCTILDNQGVGTVINDDASPDGTLFSDDFESGFTKWTETGEGDWNLESPSEIQVPGNSSNLVAHSDNCDSTCTITITNSINLSSYSSDTLSFWRFVDNALDNGEYLKVELYDGSQWNTVFNWTNNSGDDNIWHQETVNLASYIGISDFKVRFVSHESGGLEETEIDDVIITGNS
jgi:peptidoglycan/xylan/chitin deacetylase (PgdA/CDA1 family)